MFTKANLRFKSYAHFPNETGIEIYINFNNYIKLSGLIGLITKLESSYYCEIELGDGAVYFGFSSDLEMAKKAIKKYFVEYRKLNCPWPSVEDISKLSDFIIDRNYYRKLVNNKLGISRLGDI